MTRGGNGGDGKVDTLEDAMKRLLYAAPFLALLVACEDAGNEGDDNLLTGGSVVLVILVIVAIVYFVRRRR
jgi:hypothetical protein